MDRPRKGSSTKSQISQTYVKKVANILTTRGYSKQDADKHAKELVSDWKKSNSGPADPDNLEKHLQHKYEMFRQSGNIQPQQQKDVIEMAREMTLALPEIKHFKDTTSSIGTNDRNLLDQLIKFIESIMNYEPRIIIQEEKQLNVGLYYERLFIPIHKTITKKSGFQHHQAQQQQQQTQQHMQQSNSTSSMMQSPAASNSGNMSRISSSHNLPVSQPNNMQQLQQQQANYRQQSQQIQTPQQPMQQMAMTPQQVQPPPVQQQPPPPPPPPTPPSLPPTRQQIAQQKAAQQQAAQLAQQQQQQQQVQQQQQIQPPPQVSPQPVQQPVMQPPPQPAAPKPIMDTKRQIITLFSQVRTECAVFYATPHPPHF
ncbi:hypothetical protein TVAG_045130 [Trichomonas vaginalis G3]|uniref:Uncharacterized protein n=1 Tax=Trichomonas vaginalis (strain ATCC PRA-98 / G3) TaxID=412133 RepID=A2E8G1_TRIV3|nr:hypothetical protein TVAGG3_0550300 [Trichomonas vaginalis G3]EAY11089.1 hypothetical protein TVAG_045130 [Trichomonas vaginalis G3]KAI5520451.1 hypothetical protein TVAGG3_0550300 [Trichomonas vaginalis G3]|eukprot:XP_001323312.1 hypothetical protein [Trichomonas vaginalis G3]